MSYEILSVEVVDSETFENKDIIFTSFNGKEGHSLQITFGEDSIQLNRKIIKKLIKALIKTYF